MLKFYKDIALSIELINKLGDKPARVNDLADAIGTTHYNLQRLVRKLGNAGVIKSVRGKGGGVSKVESSVTLKMLFCAFYKNPFNEIKDSSSISDRLNTLYLHFLDALSVYEKDLPKIEKTRKSNEEISNNINTKEETQEELDFEKNNFSWEDGW